MLTKYLKGDIVIVDLGKLPGGIKGHEQAEKRPCVVIKSFEFLKLAIILPITSQKPPKYLYTIVELPKRTAGLRKDSFVLCHQIRTVSLDRIEGRQGKLESNDFNKIKAVLSDTLD